MSPGCTEGLNPDQTAFLEGLEQFFSSWPKQDVASQFEVTMGVAQTKGKIEPGTDFLFPIERNIPHVFVMLVGRKDHVTALAQEAADAAGGAGDPCCWWAFVNGRLICVAMCG